MQVSAGMELAALVLTFVVHIIGGAVLIYTLMGDDRKHWRDWWPRDDRPGPEAPEPPAPTGGGDSLPFLPDAVPASVRMREGERLGDQRTRPTRRPAHPPVPAAPERTPEHR
jgi:hypothetical protein